MKKLRGKKLWWIVAGVVAALAVATVWVGASYRKAEEGLLLVQDSTASMYQLSALKWQAIASSGVDDSLEDKTASTIQSLRVAGLRLTTIGAIDPSTVLLLESYLAAVEREVVLLKTGRVDAAVEFDGTHVDLMFERLKDTFSTVADVSRDEAERTDVLQTVVLAFAVAAAVTAIALTTRYLGLSKLSTDLVRSKDAFIASVSHELRTPLSAVLGFSAVLRDDSSHLAEAERIEIGSIIARAAYDVGGIVDDLLVVARTETGTIRTSRVPVDLRANTAQIFEILDSKEQARVALGDQPTGMRAWGDPLRLRQVVRNLISNALRYGGDTIRIDFELEKEQAILSVTDDGPGIPKSETDRIFLPYEIAHHVRSVPSSVGLGLAVARQLMELMGGSITHRQQDGLTVFEVRLPSVTNLEEIANESTLQTAAG